MRCQASVRIYSGVAFAAAVTERLGLAPSSAREKGLGAGSRPGSVIQTSTWMFSTSVREPSELADHLVQLLDVLEPLRVQLDALLAAGYAMDWFCFVEAGGLEHAIELDWPLLARLAAFPAPLLIDTYGAGCTPT